MSPIENPFFVGGAVPTRYFVGRTDTIGLIFSQIGNRAHLAINGSPGTGKTSLLRYVAEPEVWKARGLDPSSAAVLYLNCADIDPFTPAGFWKELFARFNKISGPQSPWKVALDQCLKNQSPARDELRTVLDGFKGHVLVLLIDDFDAALRPNNSYTDAEITAFKTGLRALCNEYGNKSLSNIVTSLQRVSDIGEELLPSGSPWYTHFMFSRLAPFDTTGADALFNKMAPVRDLLRSERDWLCELTGSRPALLQSACHILWQHLSQSKLIDAADFANELRVATSHYFRDDWRFASKEEQKAMLLIALSRLQGRVPGREYKLAGLDTAISQMGSKILDLKDRAVLEEISEGAKKTWRFRSALFEWSVVQQIEDAKDEQELAEREKVFFGLASKDVSRIKEAMRTVWQHKDAVLSVVKWAGQLVGSFGRGVVAPGT